MSKLYLHELIRRLFDHRILVLIRRIFYLLARWLKASWIFILFGVIAFGVIFIPFSEINGLTWNGYKLHVHDYNELGDYIGGITTPILSFMGIVLLYLTYRSQKEELRATQRALKSQQAATSLFSMLATLENIVSSSHKDMTKRGVISQPNETVKLSGRDLFNELYEALLPEFRNRGQKYFRYKTGTNSYHELEFAGEQTGGTKNGYVPTGKTISVEDYIVLIMGKATMFFNHVEGGVLRHYFKYVGIIIEFIDKEFENKSDRQFYYRILRSHLSDDEIGLLFYYTFTPLGKLGNGFLQARLLDDFNLIKIGDSEHFHIYNYRLKKFEQDNPEC